MPRANPLIVDAPAIHVGFEKQPLALAAENVRVPSFGISRVISTPGWRQSSASRCDSRIGKPRPRAIRSAAWLPAIQHDLGTGRRASASPKRSRDYQTPVTYPESALATRLKTVAQLIDAGLKTRVYYVELDGFDTHSQQAAAHAALLQQLSGAVRAFVEDVAHHGHGDRTLVMSFSEFGRRVAENASEGTDHGAAAPMFLAGSRVRAGLVGEHPSLNDLDDGDLKFHIDFRQVYATLLERWLGWSSTSVLGGEFKSIDVLKA